MTKNIRWAYLQQAAIGALRVREAAQPQAHPTANFVDPRVQGVGRNRCISEIHSLKQLADDDTFLRCN